LRRNDDDSDKQALQKHLIQKENNKSELMLMRRAKAYSSSCSQVVLVYLHPFCCNLRRNFILKV